MRGAALLWTLFLGGCHLLFPFSSERSARDGHVHREGAVLPPAKLDVLPPPGAEWTQIYELSRDSCPVTEGQQLEPAPDGRGCTIKGRLGCESSGGNFAGWKITPPIPYRHVLGFASGFQWNSTDAFSVQKLHDGQVPTIDDAYVEGVSISRIRTDGGGPRREHVWTYAAGLMREGGNSCPCWGGRQPPAFVGQSYTCDSGNYTDHWEAVWYPAPLWDGDAVGAGPAGDMGPASCEPLASPGWFEVTLPEQTSESLEVRILFDSCDENIALTALKLWVRAAPGPDLGLADLALDSTAQ